MCCDWWHFQVAISSTSSAVKAKGLNYLHHQLEQGPPRVEAVHRIILPFASQRQWSQRGWHARTRACQEEYTANGTARQPISRSIQSTLQRNVILYGLFNSLQIHFPFDYYTTNTQQSLQAPISDVLFSLSVPPSISLIVCLSFSVKKPTCVSTLSWHGCMFPTVPDSGSHKAGHQKLLRIAGHVAFGVWPPSWELLRGELWLNATNTGRQIESVCVKEKVDVRG